MAERTIVRAAGSAPRSMGPPAAAGGRCATGCSTTHRCNAACVRWARLTVGHPGFGQGNQIMFHLELGSGDPDCSNRFGPARRPWVPLQSGARELASACRAGSRERVPAGSRCSRARAGSRCSRARAGREPRSASACRCSRARAGARVLELKPRGLASSRARSGEPRSACREPMLASACRGPRARAQASRARSGSLASIAGRGARARSGRAGARGSRTAGWSTAASARRSTRGETRQVPPQQRRTLPSGRLPAWYRTRRTGRTPHRQVGTPPGTAPPKQPTPRTVTRP